MTKYQKPLAMNLGEISADAFGYCAYGSVADDVQQSERCTPGGLASGGKCASGGYAGSGSSGNAPCATGGTAGYNCTGGTYPNTGI